MREPAAIAVDAARTFTSSRPGTRSEQRIALRLGDDVPWLVAAPGVSVQVAISPTVARVPHTHPWFCGVMNLRGVLLPLFDLAAWLGAPVRAVDERRIVVMEAGEDKAGFLGSELPRMVDVQAAPAARPAITRMAPWLGARFAGEGGVWHEFDFPRWLAEVGRLPSQSSE